ncbi:hypothetical protein HYH02_009705 [Chlamydomonas schloesseri]|uniref:Uncharacterized protein n=1 Tax=Chlamydomonas schloesseri TaxID=2026947 RepID=A0A835TNJ0_9CHLO|nr:hypothetical protein HYH02_009705 [Chlamydomonas schloesseri]|eukprot:KAG2442221.1 hypothetical protein HYH02_009705 [Chlamydomonas schloesseri]
MAAKPAGELDLADSLDLLHLFDRIVLPREIIRHLDVHARRLLRTTSRRLRDEVDACTTSLTINRYNIAKLSATPLRRRFPALRRLAFGPAEPKDIARLLAAQLPGLVAAAAGAADGGAGTGGGSGGGAGGGGGGGGGAGGGGGGGGGGLKELDFSGYFASMSTELWEAIVRHAPPDLTLRLNANESLLRRMEVDQVLAALAALRRGRPRLTVSFNTHHSFFGFRSTEPHVLRFLSAAPYITDLGFSVGLRGRDTQHAGFFELLAVEPAEEELTAAAAAAAITSSSADGGGRGGGGGELPVSPPAAAAASGDGAGRQQQGRRTKGQEQQQPGEGEGDGTRGQMRRRGLAGSLVSLSLTHYEAEERPPLGPLLGGLHLLGRLTRLTLDCEISLQELAPLAACPLLTHLTIDLLLARSATAVRHLAMPGLGLAPPPPPPPPPLTGADAALAALAAHVNGRAAAGSAGEGGAGFGGAVVRALPAPLGAPAAAAAAAAGPQLLNPFEVDLPVLGQVASLTLGSESHPAQRLSLVFPALTSLTSAPATRKVGVYNVFDCPPLLSGATALTRLSLNAVVAVEGAAALPAAAALTSLTFTHADNESTLAVLRNAARLPALRRLGVGDHEEADEYLALAPQLLPPALLRQLRRRELQPPREPQAGSEGAPGQQQQQQQREDGGEEAAGPGPEEEDQGEGEGPVEVEVLCYPRVETLELKATTPEFFDEFLLLLRAGALRFGDDVGGLGAASSSSSGGNSSSSSSLCTVRLDACYDPPLLQPARLGQLLAALGPGLARAVVSGWATPGSEAALLSLARRIGRHPALRMEYEYPIL